MLLKAANDNQPTRLATWSLGFAVGVLVCSLVIGLIF